MKNLKTLINKLDKATDKNYDQEQILQTVRDLSSGLDELKQISFDKDKHFRKIQSKIEQLGDIVEKTELSQEDLAEKIIEDLKKEISLINIPEPQKSINIDEAPKIMERLSAIISVIKEISKKISNKVLVTNKDPKKEFIPVKLVDERGNFYEAKFYGGGGGGGVIPFRDQNGKINEALIDADTRKLQVDAAITGDVSIAEPVSVAPDKASSAGISTGVSVGNTSTTVLASNADRKEATLVNDSDEEIYLKFGTGAALNSGIRLNAYGGTRIEDIYTGIITAICASGSKNITVTEV